jgi:hypothetical protein
MYIYYVCFTYMRCTQRAAASESVAEPATIFDAIAMPLGCGVGGVY